MLKQEIMYISNIQKTLVVIKVLILQQLVTLHLLQVIIMKNQFFHLNQMVVLQ